MPRPCHPARGEHQRVSPYRSRRWNAGLAHGFPHAAWVSPRSTRGRGRTAPARTRATRGCVHGVPPGLGGFDEVECHGSGDGVCRVGRGCRIHQHTEAMSSMVRAPDCVEVGKRAAAHCAISWRTAVGSVPVGVPNTSAPEGGGRPMRTAMTRLRTENRHSAVYMLSYFLAGRRRCAIRARTALRARSISMITGALAMDCRLTRHQFIDSYAWLKMIVQMGGEGATRVDVWVCQIVLIHTVSM